MLLGELLLLLLAVVDKFLRATKLLRISVERPQRPSAEQFARQQKRRLSENSTPTSTTTTAAATKGATTTAATATVERRLDAVVIGGGAAGVSTAAALHRAGLSSVVVLERNASPGDVWRKRYASLTLHDIADDVALPFVKIPDSLPVYLPAGVFADYLDFHARIHRVDFRGGVEAAAVEPLVSSSSSSSSAAVQGGEGNGASSSASRDRWRVKARPVAESDGSNTAASSSSSSTTFEAENVIFCDGGLYNKPKIPAFAQEANKNGFLGEVLHSSQLNAKEGSCARFAGRRVLVVGFGE